MKLFCTALIALLGATMAAPSAHAAGEDFKVAFHVQSPAASKQCSKNAPSAVTCSDFSTAADLGVPYDVYVVVAGGTEHQGVSFGVNYGHGIYLTWQRCSDLEFPSLSWPNAGSTTTATWSTCQLNTPGTDGAQTVVGWFDATAYSASRLAIIPGAIGEVRIADCAAVACDISNTSWGAVDFFAGAADIGYNPCSGVGTPPPPPAPDTIGPSAVTLSVTSTGETSMRFEFNAPEDAEGEVTAYEFRYVQGETFPVADWESGTLYPTGTPEPPGSPETVFIFNGLAPMTPYTARLRSRDDSGNWSPLSNEATGVTGETPPPPPPDTNGPPAVTLSVTSTTEESLVFGFTAPADAEGQVSSYEFRYVQGAVFAETDWESGIQVHTGTPRAPGSVETVSVFGLNPATAYTARVRSRDDSNNWSPLSNQATGMTGQAPPPPPPPLDPRLGGIALHVTDIAGGARCTNGPATSNDIVTAREIPNGYWVYLVPGTPVPGSLAGIVLAIEYGSLAEDGVGLDIGSWAKCADQQFPQPEWPESGSGNIITWAASTNCQTGDVAIAGVFEVFAYDPAVMRIIPHPTELMVKYADCSAASHELEDSQLGWLSFGGASMLGDNDGCNPLVDNCYGSAVPIRPMSWGAIKTTLGAIQVEEP